MLGLLKSVAQEVDWINCRYVDLPVDQLRKQATRICDELCICDHDIEVAYRDKLRLVPSLEEVEFDRRIKQGSLLKTGGMYLITGGLGGIGFELSRFLLENYRAHLLLVGRTALPSRSEWDLQTTTEQIKLQIWSYRELEKLRGQIRYSTGRRL